MVLFQHLFSILLLLTITVACLPQQVHQSVNTSISPRLEQKHYLAGDGVELPIRSWLPQHTPPRAVIIALHGFNDYSNAFAAPGVYLSSRGIACYAYDQRGFGNAPGRGLWAGTEAYSRDLTGFTRSIRKQHPGIPLYLLGESMGGAVAMAATTGSNAPPVDGLILVAPAVWARSTMPWYQRWLLAIASRTVPWLELTGKGLDITPSDNIEMRRALGRDPLVIKATRVDTLRGLTDLMDAALAAAPKLQQPTLIQYGKHDQIIPKEPTLQMLATVPPNVRTAFYAEGYHMLLRDLQAEKPLADIVAWVTDRNGSLPYGAERWE